MKVTVTSEMLMARYHELAKDYRKANGIYGNKALYIKAVILFTALGITWWLLFIIIPSTNFHLIIKFMFGFIVAYIYGKSKAGIGFNVMHDAAHGSFSKRAWVNRWLSYSLNLLGGDHRIWDWQHNKQHHPETNIAGNDHDIDTNGLGRFSYHQPWKPWHKYQHLYMRFFYAISYTAWVFYLDYGKAKKMGWSKNKRIILFLRKLFLNNLPFIIIPFIIAGPWYYVLIMWLYSDMVCGYTTSSVFQLAHVVENTEMLPPTDKKLETKKARFDALHQLKTTASFAVNNKFIFWYTGGLNFQTLHHIDQWTSHIHYRVLHRCLAQACREFGVHLIVYPTMADAKKSHYRQLKKLGRKEPDYERHVFI